MTNKIIVCLYLAMISISISTGCKNDNSSNQTDLFAKRDTGGINKTKPIATNGVFADTAVKSSFNDPQAVANNKFSHFDTVLMKDLCKKVWKFDGGIDGGKNITEKDLEGYWIQFYPEGNYEKGTFNKITSKGSFTVNNQGFIELLPNNSKEKKSEWQSKFNNDMLIFVGTPKYNDNAIQMRLSRIESKPEKPK